MLNQAQTNDTSQQSLLSMLQSGGYILYVRHAEATVGIDQPHLNFHDCQTQRNLSTVGRREAANYGNLLRQLEVPVMIPIVASPLCRTYETAALAFGIENIHVDPFLFEIYRLSLNITQTERGRIINQLQHVFATQPPAGQNLVIIAHSFPQGIGFGPMPNMGTVIVRPLGPTVGFEIVDQLSLAEFTRFGN